MLGKVAATNSTALFAISGPKCLANCPHCWLARAVIQTVLSSFHTSSSYADFEFDPPTHICLNRWEAHNLSDSPLFFHSQWRAAYPAQPSCLCIHTSRITRTWAIIYYFDGILSKFSACVDSGNQALFLLHQVHVKEPGYEARWFVACNCCIA